MKRVLFFALALAIVIACLAIPVFAIDSDSAGNVFSDGNEKMPLDIDGDYFLIDGESALMGSGETISGKIGGDLLGLTSDITADKLELGGSFRALAFSVNCSELTARNITLCAETVTFGEKTKATGLYLACSTGNIDGSFVHASIAGGTVNLIGSFGDVEIAAENVYISESADIAALKISSPNEPMVYVGNDIESAYSYKESRFASAIDYTKTETNNNNSQFGSILISLLISITTAAALALILRKKLPRLGDIVRTETGKTIGFGFLGLFVLPLAALLSMLLMVTILLSISLLLVYAALVILASALTACILSEVLLPRLNRMLGSVIFAAAITLVSMLPYIGWIFGLGSAIVAFGAVITMLFSTPAAPAELPLTPPDVSHPYEV